MAVEEWRRGLAWTAAPAGSTTQLPQSQSDGPTKSFLTQTGVKDNEASVCCQFSGNYCGDPGKEEGP